jgi:Cell Wall Hydrolase
LTAALRSTLVALLHEPVAMRRLGLWGIVAAFFPIGIGLQAMSLPAEMGPAEVGHSRSSLAQSSIAKPRVDAPRAPLSDFTIPSDTKLLQPGVTPARIDLVGAKPFLFAGSLTAREQSVTCLAAAAWYEAGNDAVSQRSVIQVVLNRFNHPSFPKTICGVVLQGSERSTGCQFSFTCDGSLYRRRPSPASLAAARQMAEAALSGAVDISVSQATHYHADYVAPWWSKKLERLGTVGRHIFYRWFGAQGALSGQAKNQMPVASAQFARLETDANGNLVSRKNASERAGPTEFEMAYLPVAPSTAALARPAIAAAPTLGSPAKGGAIITVVNNPNLSGRWALDALGRCPGESGCLVLGYASAEIAARNSDLPGSQRDRPLFLLIRDRTSGQVLALWDCDTVQRPDTDQCLPHERTQLNSLMRERAAS